MSCANGETQRDRERGYTTRRLVAGEADILLGSPLQDPVDHDEHGSQHCGKDVSREPDRQMPTYWNQHSRQRNDARSRADRPRRSPRSMSDCLC